jgi:hypothetical protein
VFFCGLSWKVDIWFYYGGGIVPIKLFLQDLNTSLMLPISLGVGEFEFILAPNGGVETNYYIKFWEGCTFSLFDFSSSSKGPIPAKRH